MRIKGKLWLTVMVLLLSVILYIFAFGFSFGIREFRPIAQQFKDRKMMMDLNQGTYAIFAPKDDEEVTSAEIDRTVNVIRSRLEFLGYSDSLVSKQGEDKISVNISVTGSITATLLDFLIKPAEVQIKDPDGNVIISSDDIASARYERMGNDYVVVFVLTKEGKQKYEEATSKLINSKIKIYVDGQVEQEKTVKEVIKNGEDYISNYYSASEVIELAAQINSGPAVSGLEIDEASAVSAANGYRSFRQITAAGFIAAALAIIAMIILYRIPGLMVSVSFLYFVAISAFCVLTIPNVRLSMSGFIGFLIAAAVFIDTNIIIADRIKEELKSGKTFETAFQLGFSKTFSTITYSNLAIVVMAFGLMFIAGSSNVDFAYVLVICVAVSYLVTYTISRALVKQAVKIGIKNTGLYLGIKGENR